MGESLGGYDRMVESHQDQAVVFVERRDEIAGVLQRSFAGAPWFEDLSEEECLDRVESHAMKPGFEAILVFDRGSVIAGLWYDTPSLEELCIERGVELGGVVERLREEHGVQRIVWQRETVVDPEYQGRGLATHLRRQLLEKMTHDGSCPTVLLTRMRDDNTGIIAVAHKFGYLRTGIRMPSSQNPYTSHEYWYKVINHEQ